MDVGAVRRGLRRGDVVADRVGCRRVGGGGARGGVWRGGLWVSLLLLSPGARRVVGVGALFGVHNVC